MRVSKTLLATVHVLLTQLVVGERDVYIEMSQLHCSVQFSKKGCS